MQDKTTDAYGAPQIADKRTPATGSIPKNTQGLLIIGLAIVKVSAMRLTACNAQTDRPAPTPTTSGVTDPNGARIQEYKKRLDEATRKLETQQAHLAQEERAVKEAASAAAHPALVSADYRPAYPPSEAKGIQ